MPNFSKSLHRHYEKLWLEILRIDVIHYIFVLQNNSFAAAMIIKKRKRQPHKHQRNIQKQKVQRGLKKRTKSGRIIKV